jgi:hypothetical protein
MRNILLLAGAMLGCAAAPRAAAPSVATSGESGLQYVVLTLDKLK